MIGMLAHAVQLLASESGLTKKIGEVMFAPSDAEVVAQQKKDAAAKRAKERAAKKKREEAVYKLAIELEKKRLIESNEKAKNFDEDILLEFASKRLTEQLQSRIAEYLQQRETLGHEIAEIDDKIMSLSRQRKTANQQAEASAEFKAEQKRVQRLNEMYATYIEVCGKNGTPDDIGMLEIMTAVKKLKITEAELNDIKAFASQHGYASGTVYLEEPQRPIDKRKKGMSVAEAEKLLRQLEEDKKTKSKERSLLSEIIDVLKKRVPEGGDVCDVNGNLENETASIQEESAPVDIKETSQDVNVSKSPIDIILQTFESCRGVDGLDELYLGQDIPDDKLSNAAESMKPKENLVAVLWDTTVFGSAKDGMLVTEKAVYFKNLWEAPKRYTWNRILKLKNDGGGDFSLGNFTFNTADEDAANVVYDALIAVAQEICAENQ